MDRNLTIEKNHVYIINTSLSEYLKEIGLYKKFEDYNFINQKLEIYAICRDYERGTLVEFFFSLEGYGNLEFITGVLCEDEYEVEAKIFRQLPQLLEESDLRKLIKTLENVELCDSL